jgi:hypothetical protein
MKQLTLEELLNFVKEQGFVPQEDNINFIALRANMKFDNKFTDDFYWYYKQNDIWVLEFAKITTKAGLTYVKHPLNSKGTAVLKPGLHKDAFILGRHKNSYRAIVQHAPLPVWRDKTKDDIIDPIIEDNGIFGINIHRSVKEGEAENVNDYSAGCLAFKSGSRFSKFIKDVIENTNKNGLYSLLLINKTVTTTTIK